MRHDPASVIVMVLRSLKMYGVAKAVAELTEQASLEAAIPILSVNRRATFCTPDHNFATAEPRSLLHVDEEAESNAISEAFVKTFKRGHVRISALPDAFIVLRQIAGWIDDYNEIHPHSALRMRSPREFIRAQIQPGVR